MIGCDWLWSCGVAELRSCGVVELLGLCLGLWLWCRVDCTLLSTLQTIRHGHDTGKMFFLFFRAARKCRYRLVLGTMPAVEQVPLALRWPHPPPFRGAFSVRAWPLRAMKRLMGVQRCEGRKFQFVTEGNVPVRRITEGSAGTPPMPHQPIARKLQITPPNATDNQIRRFINEPGSFCQTPRLRKQSGICHVGAAR